MEINEIQVAQKLQDLLNRQYKSDLFTLSPLDNAEMKKALGKNLPDFELFYKDRLIGAVEIKRNLVFLDKIVTSFKESLGVDYHYLIITNGSLLKIYDLTSSADWKVPIFDGDFSQSVRSILLSSINPTDEQTNILQIRKWVYNSLMELKEKGIEFGREVPFDYDKQQIDYSYFIDHNKKEVTVLSNTSQGIRFEYLLFELLVEQVKLNADSSATVYRYTTLDTVFNTIKNTSYRFNGIQGMNDQSEGLFILKSIYGDGNGFESNQALADRFNEIFISSCSVKMDDLTMWRLYGDNSKGACLEIEISAPKRHSPFLLGAVSYVDRNRRQILSILFNLVRQVRSLGYSLNPKLFSLILFFLKHHQYRVEREVRIIYDSNILNTVTPLNPKMDWGFAEPYKIIRPYIDIDFLTNAEKIEDLIPFKITRIWLGPNCPKEEKNMLQLNTLIRQKGLDYIDVKSSSIDHDVYIG